MLRRRIDRRPLALSVAVGLVALLLGATRPDRSPPLFGAGLLGGRDALVSIPPDQVDGAAYLKGSTVLRLADGRRRGRPPYRSSVTAGRGCIPMIPGRRTQSTRPAARVVRGCRGRRPGGRGWGGRGLTARRPGGRGS